MIGYGIFFCKKLCGVDENGIYAICFKKERAEQYAKELSEARGLEYKAQKVSIGMLE